MKSKMSTQEAWVKLFEKYNILNNINKYGHYGITASEINEFREARLMTKFDHNNSRPPLFKDNNLTILPVDNGKYIIGKFDVYKKLSKVETPIEQVSLPDFITSIELANIYSESNALNVALISGMLNKLFDETVYETISGRMRADKFEFNILNGAQNHRIRVDKPQIEIDGGYESKNRLLLIEAKNYKPSDFIIRQLYYPFRFWKEKIKKEVVPIFFTYENGEYSFYIYQFSDNYNYNSLNLVSKRVFTIVNTESNNARYTREYINEDNEIPFPQADSFNTVKNLLYLINDGITENEEIILHLDFTSRQVDYYLNALRYLDLVEKGTRIISKKGRKLVDSPLTDQNKMMAQIILEHQVFGLCYDFYLKNKEIPSKEFISQIMLKSELNIDSTSTINRRASTVLGWIKWIVNNNVL